MTGPFMPNRSTWGIATLVGLLAAGGAWTVASSDSSTAASVPQQLFQKSDVAALADAAAKGRVADIRRILDAGVNVNSKGMRGLTPLGYALIRHNLDGAQALLKHGADPNFTYEDDVYKEPLPFILIVAAKGSAEELALLLQYGGNANARAPIRRDAAPDRQYEGDSVLIESASDLAKVKALVQHGADVNYVPHPDSASTSRSAAIVKAAGLAQLEVVDFLLDHGAIDLDETVDALQGRPWAVEQRAQLMEVMRKLREKGGRIYASYRPLRSEKLEAYPPQDTPTEWISPGFLDMREVWKNIESLLSYRNYRSSYH
jgi:hypothetical protein